jgi:DNA-binding NarL/FixJ family response regulator
MNILVLEDHPLMLDSIAKHVESSVESNVYKTSNINEAECIVFKNKIDLLILDLELKDGACGINFYKNIKTKFPNLKAVAYTSFSSLHILKQIQDAKFNSYVFKQDEIRYLNEAILKVSENTSDTFYKSSSFNKQLDKFEGCINKFFNKSYSVDKSLTKQEKLIMDIVDKDPTISNSQIADMTDSKVNTVKKHITSIYKKLCVNSKEGIAILSCFKKLN